MTHYKVIRTEHRGDRTYRKGEIVDVDSITARCLDYMGVIDTSRPLTPEGDPLNADESGDSGESSEVSQNEDSGESDNTGFRDEIRERASQALEDDDYREMRKVLGDAEGVKAPQGKDDCIELLEQIVEG